MNAPSSKITGVPGWESEAEQDLLLELAKQVPQGGTIVEIGAEFGMSASLFIHGTNASQRIFSVDLFPGDLISVHRQNLNIAELGGRSKQIAGDSGEVGKNWKQGGIDLLFIDGDHTYKGCKADIEAWIPHVNPGGVVAFHDCACTTNPIPHPLHFEVTKAVSEWFMTTNGAWQSLGSVDSILVFKRLK